MNRLFLSALAAGTAGLVSLAPLRADTPLGEQMDKMKAANRELKTALASPSDADKQDYLALVARLRDAAAASRDLDPEKTAEIPEAERPAFLEGYRKAMDELIVLIDGLKQHVADGNWDRARAQMEQLRQAQREGHKEYRSEKD